VYAMATSHGLLGGGVRPRTVGRGKDRPDDVGGVDESWWWVAPGTTCQRVMKVGGSWRRKSWWEMSQP
jgi:hypothetical protein